MSSGIKQVVVPFYFPFSSLLKTMLCSEGASKPLNKCLVKKFRMQKRSPKNLAKNDGVRSTVRDVRELGDGCFNECWTLERSV